MGLNEADRPAGEPKPTPQELKTAIVNIFQSLPYRTDLVEDEGFEVFQRRASSEYKRVLVKLFGRLLEHARPYTTRVFRQELARGFNLACELGVDQENPSHTPLFSFLGLDYEDRNSIYDTELVPELEHRSYRQLLREALDHERMMTSERTLERIKTRNPELYEDWLDIFVHRKDRGKRWSWEKQLERWRQDYIARWGDEP